jgi:hypothetical protein
MRVFTGDEKHRARRNRLNLRERVEVHEAADARKCGLRRLQPRLSVAGEAALIAATVLLLFLFALVLRNSLRPKWLDSEEISMLAALAITVMLSVAFSASVKDLIDLGPAFPVALAAGVVFCASVSIVLWALLKMSDRLKACETGRSPFRLRG